MDEKALALRLANLLNPSDSVESQAAAELRRLHAVNQELLEALDFYGRYILRNKHTREASILTPIEHDCGDRARAAIARAEGEKT
jgi:hypothetical protein